MQFTIDSKAFAQALAEAINAVSTRGEVAILRGAHLNAWGDTLTVSCTDMEKTLRVTAPCETEAAGVAILLDAKQALQGVKTLGGKLTVAVSREGEELTISSKGTTIRFQLGNVLDYPKLPERPKRPVMVTDVAELRRVWGTVEPSVSRDESRPVLTGVHVIAPAGEGKRGKAPLEFVGTDSYRLTVDMMEATGVGKDGIDWILPGAAVSLLTKLAPKTGKIEWFRHEKRAFATVGTIEVSARIIDGQFPNHDQLIPEVWPCTVTVNREELLEAAKRIKTLSRFNTPIRLTMTQGKKQLTAWLMGGRDYGPSVETKLKADVSLDAKELIIGINASFFFDAVSSFQGETVTLKLILALRSMLIVDEDSETLLQLLMPIRLAS